MKKNLLVLLLVLTATFVSVFASEPVTIWTWSPEAGHALEVAAETMRNNGKDIDVEVTVFAPTEYKSKVNIALQSGSGPDLVTAKGLPDTSTKALIDNEMYLAVNDKIDFSNYSQTILDGISKDGKVYGVPINVQVVGVFYNKDYYDQYNLNEPKTWDELVSNAEVLKKNGITPFFVSGKDGWTLAMQHAMCGVSLLGPDFLKDLIDGKETFLSPEWVEVGNKLNELKEYYQPGYLANGDADSFGAFAFGQAAMVFYGFWGMNPWTTLNPDLNVGYFMVPPATADQDAYAYSYFDAALTLTSSTKNPDKAIEFLSFLATPEFGSLYAEVKGDIPAINGITAPDKPLFKEIAETFENHSAPYFYWKGSVFVSQKPSLYSDILIPGMQSMYADKITPEELGKMAQDGISQWYAPFQNK